MHETTLLVGAFLSFLHSLPQKLPEKYLKNSNYLENIQSLQMMSPQDSMNPSKPPSFTSARKHPLLKPPEQTLNCPRCESPNTKFCYYNNYSLSQPRHFCKTCRRYWTKGGALRNVPIGGGCRKNKKNKASSRLSSDDSSKSGAADHSSASSDIINAFSIYHGQGLPPAMELQLGRLPFASRILNSSAYDHNNNNYQFRVPSNGTSATAGLAPFMGFNSYPAGLRHGDINTSMGSYGGNGVQEIAGSLTMSSIESLSSMNQDLHWKLQQQRLAMHLNQEEQKVHEGHDQQVTVIGSHQVMRPQAISFGNLEIPKEVVKGGAGDGNLGVCTDWFLHGNNTENENDANVNVMSNWNSGYHQGWSSHDLQQYHALSQ